MGVRDYIVGDKIIFRKWALFQDLRDIKGVITKISYHKDNHSFYGISYIDENNIQKTCNLFPSSGSRGTSDKDESMILDIQATREDEINKILNIII